MTARRFGRRADEAPDHPARTLYCCEAFAITADLPEPDSPCSTSGRRSGPWR